MKLYTIGYEGLSRDAFFTLLQNHEISVVADVRHLPLSRKKGFSKSSLGQSLKDKNIGYINFRELGTSKEMRNELKATGDYGMFFKKFKKSISNKYDQLDEICSILHDDKKVALLCFERNHEVCHRKIVAQAVKTRDGNGLEIKHI